MNGKDKISVIIPCYNVQKYIMRCFDSIYSQTYGFENLEVILIDDLSTDNTWSILESLCFVCYLQRNIVRCNRHYTITLRIQRALYVLKLAMQRSGMLRLLWII